MLLVGPVKLAFWFIIGRSLDKKFPIIRKIWGGVAPLFLLIDGVTWGMAWVAMSSVKLQPPLFVVVIVVVFCRWILTSVLLLRVYGLKAEVCGTLGCVLALCSSAADLAIPVVAVPLMLAMGRGC